MSAENETLVATELAAQLEEKKENAAIVDFTDSTYTAGQNYDKAYLDDNSRYMLWVQRRNVSAMALYRNKGFAPINKSTLSMIKL